MKVALTFSTLTYSGWSIGRDIRVEVAMAGKTSVYEKRMRPFHFTRPDIPLGVIEAEEGQEIPILIKVIEKDRAYLDTGEARIIVVIPQPSVLPKTYTAELQVAERRFVFLKVRAKFAVGIEMRAIPQESPALRQYRSYRSENYNRYDNIISEVVTYWNNQFAQDTDPPSKLLDPNLVKAMAYQETRVGNDPLKNGLVDIMQAGNAKDPALKTLRGEKTEYWTHHDEQIKLKYLNAKIETVYDSVFWGVRWLYHKAHENIRHEDGSWGNKWRPWKDAVDYYGPRDPKYIENVWNIYKNGIVNKDGEVKLWSFSGLLLAVVFSAFGWFGVSDEDIQHSFATHFDFRSAAYREGIEVIRDEHSPFILAYESDDKNWSEWVGLGFVKANKIEWLDDHDLNSQLANGILSARFVKLAGFPESVLEVFDTTHMGNGSIHLYSLNQNTRQIRPIFEACAVDNYHDHIWNPDGYPELGGDWEGDCSVYYKNGRLQPQYKDVNNDGADDVILTGTQQIFCSRNGHDADELVKEKDIYEEYILQPGQYQNPKQCVSMNNFFSL